MQPTHDALLSRMRSEHATTGRRTWTKDEIVAWFPDVPRHEIVERLDESMYLDGLFLNGLRYQLVV